MSVDSWREILIVSAMYVRECAKTNMGTNTFASCERERKKRPQQRVEGQEGKESDESDGHNIAHDDFYISFN